MTLKDVLSKFNDYKFYLSVSGVCEELYGGADYLLHDEIGAEHLEKEVVYMSILNTYGIPELVIGIHNE